MKLTTYLLLIPRLRMHGPVLALPTSTFMLWIGTAVPYLEQRMEAVEDMLEMAGLVVFTVIKINSYSYVHLAQHGGQ
jgi:hypothetical protein